MFFRKKEGLQRLNLEAPRPGPAPPSTASPASPAKPARNAAPDPPKPYIQIQNPNGGRSLLAHPVQFLPGRYQQNTIQPGSHDPLGNPGIWANDNLGAKGYADWIDDPHAGLFSRKLYVVKDALGAKGRIGGVPYEFGAVLQIGENVVIYRLDNLDTCAYIVYGFPIQLVDAVGAMARYLRRVREGREKLTSAALGSAVEVQALRIMEIGIRNGLRRHGPIGARKPRLRTLEVTRPKAIEAGFGIPFFGGKLLIHVVGGGAPEIRPAPDAAGDLFARR